MKKDERQVSPEISGIRRDHVARYEFAADQLKDCKSVLDVACGVGYGSNLLAKSGLTVTGVDIDAEAIEYARKHYKHLRATFAKHDANNLKETKNVDAAVAFECIEHLKDPRQMLNGLRQVSNVLLASVPNEDVFPWNNTPYHFQHYTKGQFQSLLNECGWQVTEWFGQEGWESEVEPNTNGRTLIAKCVRGDVIKFKPIDVSTLVKPKSPKHVSILGLGPSFNEYTNITKRLGGRHKFCDETWAINSLGSVVQCDRIFHMDDVRIQEIRAEAKPESNIAAMLEWMRETKTPIITSRPHPDYPATEPFPLIEVLNEFDTGYFNSTAAYAVAYAIWLGAERISLFGVDFTYPNAHDAEKGRACVEYWLGMASERGIKLTIPKTSTLLDAIHTQRERFYGYDTLDMKITQDDHGAINIEFTEREDLPTAEEVEEAYNHEKHPNALMVEEK